MHRYCIKTNIEDRKIVWVNYREATHQKNYSPKTFCSYSSIHEEKIHNLDIEISFFNFFNLNQKKKLWPIRYSTLLQTTTFLTLKRGRLCPLEYKKIMIRDEQLNANKKYQTRRKSQDVPKYIFFYNYNYKLFNRLFK